MAKTKLYAAYKARKAGGAAVASPAKADPKPASKPENKPKFKPVQVTDESLDAYEKERLAGLEKLAKVAPVGVKGPKWVPPKLNDDGSLADPSA